MTTIKIVDLPYSPNNLIELSKQEIEQVQGGCPVLVAIGIAWGVAAVGTGIAYGIASLFD